MQEQKVHEWPECTIGLGIYGTGLIRDDKKYLIESVPIDWHTNQYHVSKIDKRNGKRKVVARYAESDLEKAKYDFSKIK